MVCSRPSHRHANVTSGNGWAVPQAPTSWANMRILKSIAVWLLILLGAIANGVLREAVLLPRLGTKPAYVLSGLLLGLVILGVTLGCIRWLGVQSQQQALRTGAFWLLLTLVFEFGFGRFVQGRSWPVLLEAYTFRDGNLWPLVLLVTLFAPLIALRSRGGMRF